MNRQTEIVELLPTAIFPNQLPLKQIAILKLLQYKEPQSLMIELMLDQTAVESKKVVLQPGEQSLELLIPDVEAPVQLEVRLYDEAGVLLHQLAKTWQPQRKWKVYMIKSSHYDLGYDGRIDHMQAEAADYLDLARRLCEDKAQLHEWHYHIEHLGFIRAYEKERGEKALRQFLESYVKKPYMTLFGNPNGPHWHWMDYEEMVRASYPARREMKDRFGVEVDALAVVDVPHPSWSAYQLLAQSGFKYLFVMRNGFRGPGKTKHLGLPRLFWATGPDGNHKILCSMHQSYGEKIWFGQGGGYGNYVEEAVHALSKRLMKVEAGREFGDYPYDTLVLSNYVDWEIPHEDERVLRAWREKYRFPELHLDNAAQGLAHIVEKYGDQIPVINGETNNYWADFASIDPGLQGIKRRSAKRLPFSEGLAALALLQGKQTDYPGRALRDLYDDLIQFDEHCWPTMLPGNDMNIFNTSIVKKNHIHRTEQNVERILGELTGQWGGWAQADTAALDSPVPGEVVVWNPLAHARKELVRLHKPEAGVAVPTHVRDMHTGATMPVQVLDDQSWVFPAELPAYGYRRFQLIQSGAGAEQDLPFQVEEHQDSVRVRSPFYELELDGRTGRWMSLKDLRTGLECLDTTAEYAFNQLLRVTTGEFSYTATDTNIAIESIGESRFIRMNAGPAAVEIVCETTDPAGFKALSTYKLYRDLDRIDVHNRIEQADFLHTPAKDRYKENLFVAYPFAVNDPQFHVEYTPGIVNPAKDMLPSVKDFVMVNRWVDVSNSQFGITLVTHEAPTMHLGKIMYNQFSPDYVPDRGHLYSYAWSNRMSGLIKLNASEYEADLNYSFRVHEGGFRASDAAGFGWQQGNPPEARLVAHGSREGAAQESFIELSESHVQVSVLKRSEAPGRGFIARFVETAGRDATACLARLPWTGKWPGVKVWLCDPVENDLMEVDCSGEVLTFGIKAFEVLTFRFERTQEPIPAVQSFTVAGEGDSRMRLRWDRPEERAEPLHTHIYRSEDPEAPPTEYIRIASLSGAEYTDTDLHPGKDYYYQVAHANAFNSQGPITEAVKGSTSLNNTTPPARIEDIGVIPMDADRLVLYWRRSRDPDLSHYELYRGSHADFEADERSFVAKLSGDKYEFQLYEDVGLEPNETRYYRVLPVDYAGNRQPRSICVSGATPGQRRFPEERV